MNIGYKTHFRYSIICIGKSEKLSEEVSLCISCAFRAILGALCLDTLPN